MLLAFVGDIYAAESLLTLDQAWQIAEEANPALNAAQANLAAAEGQLTDTRSLLWNNPHVNAEGLRRMVPQPGASDGVQREWRAQISQTLEVAGQQGYRRTAAEQELAALQESLEETRRQVRADVERGFVRVLSLQARAAMEAEVVALIRDNVSVARKRFEAGEDTKLDNNLAEVELGRADNQLEAVREQLLGARADLAATLQLPAKALPEVQGNLVSEAPDLPYSLEQLLSTASTRPRLRALDHREQAARSRLGLERAAVYPDVTVGLFAGREGPVQGRERIMGLSVSLPLPLFRRNAAGIGRAGTELTQVQLERQAAIRDTSASVIVLWQKLESVRQRVNKLEQFVLRRLRENQRLSATAYRTGEISLTQLLLATRQVLDTRREVLDALTELALTRVELEQAAGWARMK
ncbi:TolC family protein [Cupriavidus sp. Agwp_2]|uniref:TolC family protein n=1 Tax=Cupriavidus sp. Agwp_2 TaxID=2897324 RepID=UPI00345F1D0D